MNEVSLREHLAELGWGFEYLNRDGSIARAGLFQGAPCFEPFDAHRRTLDGKRLPINQALPSGTRIKFLPSLKFDVLPNHKFVVLHYASSPRAIWAGGIDWHETVRAKC